MIDNTLIENALALTGKTMEDMEEVSGVIYQQEELTYRFSIEKFCYYLLSPEFLEKIDTSDNWSYAEEIWLSIASYQYWDEQPLINTLQKICHE